MEWTSETEKLLFWVYDDLHCPKPLSPMYEDIGGWWLSCDHMFRRFGTPFATDWIYKNVNGYLYTAAIPAEAGVDVAHAGVQLHDPPDRPRGRRVRRQDRRLPGRGPARLRPRSSRTGGASRFVPEMQRNFDYIEGMLDQKDQLSLAEVAVLLEDAIDMHDRHWKIHWMLNFAQLSATLNLRAVMEKTHGKIDEVLLGRLQNSANDRNWDKIKALWEMKEEVKADAGPVRHLRGPGGRRDRRPPSRPASAAAGSSTSGSSRTRRSSAGTRSGATSSSSRASGRTWTPVVQLVRDQYASDYDYPTKIAALAADIDAAAKEILEGLEGEALEEMRAANEINLRMAPLTPDHHFYIDQGANAHVRLVLIALGEKLVAMGVLDAPDDVILFRYNELRAFIGNPAGMDGRAIVAAARAKRAAAETIQPKDWVGTVTATQLAFPYLNLWGFPDKFTRSNVKVARPGQRHRRLAGRGRGRGARRHVRGRVRQPDGGRDPRLPDDQPGLAGALRQDLRGRHRRRRDRVASGRSRPRVRHPRGRGHLGGHVHDQDRRPPPRGRQLRHRRSSCEAAAAIRQTEPKDRMTAETTISRSVLSDTVKDRLLEAILDGRYPPGSRIVETRAAREFGTSQAPVREALRDLEALGVVEIAPFRGARVRRPSLDELLEAYVVRSELEALVVRLAVPRLTDEDLGVLGGYMDAMDWAAEAGDTVAEAAADAAVPRAPRGDRRQRHPRACLGAPRALLAHLHQRRRPGRGPPAHRRAPRPGPRSPPDA